MTPPPFCCPFCGVVLDTTYWDEVDEHVMACRDKATPRARGDLDSYTEEEFNRPCPWIELGPAFDPTLAQDPTLPAED